MHQHFVMPLSAVRLSTAEEAGLLCIYTSRPRMITEGLPPMCGRYANAATMPEMRDHYEAGGPEVAWDPSWNICPTRQIPVMLGGDGGLRIGLMRWGWNPAGQDTNGDTHFYPYQRVLTYQTSGALR